MQLRRNDVQPRQHCKELTARAGGGNESDLSGMGGEMKGVFDTTPSASRMKSVIVRD